MTFKYLLKIIIYLILLTIALFIGYISIIAKFLVPDSELYIKALGLIFVIIFTIFQSLLKDKPVFSDIITWTGEFNTRISLIDMENLIFKSSLKTARLIIIFGTYNLILVLINLIGFSYISWGNIIFSGLLIWPIYGRFQIRREIENSIYNSEKVKTIIKTDLIELITEKIHHKINNKDLEFIYKTPKWIIFKRIKYYDYVIFENK